MRKKRKAHIVNSSLNNIEIRAISYADCHGNFLCQGLNSGKFFRGKFFRVKNEALFF